MDESNENMKSRVSQDVSFGGASGRGNDDGEFVVENRTFKGRVSIEDENNWGCKMDIYGSFKGSKYNFPKEWEEKTLHLFELVVFTQSLSLIYFIWW